MKRLLNGLASLALVVAVQGAAAHDLWIEPTTFFPRIGQGVGARLLVGVDLVGEPLPRVSSLIDRFVAADDAGLQPAIGRERADPAGAVRPRVPGLMVIGYHSRPSSLELPEDKFDVYLREEGLDEILDKRRRGEAKGNGTREQFFRCAKSLLWVEQMNSAHKDQLLGFPLELLAERNPYLHDRSEDLPIRLLYEGRPLAGALVVALREGEKIERLSARSDSDGRVRFRITGEGMWLIKAVHMVATPARSDREAGWASYWASLTFGTRARPNG